MRQTTSVLLGDLPKVLVGILNDLMASDLERRPFVIVEDTVTGRFAQFIRRYKPKTGELLFDVPALGLILLPCPNPTTGAKWAVDALSLRFGLPDDAMLVIQIDGDPSN